MRGIMIASVLCVVMCLHYADAQWPTWVLSKGKTCEDRCKTKLKMCKPVEEFMDCNCIPRQVLQNYLKYATLPIEPSVICLMSSPKAPKCCGIYNKQKDAFKNSESDSQEIQQLKDKLDAEQTENEQCKTKLGAEQTENEQCKTKLDSEQDQHDELKKTCGSSRQDNVCMSNLTADMFHTLGEKNRIQDAGIQQLKENLSNLSAVMSSTIQQLEKRLHSEQQVQSDALETKVDAEILQLSSQTTEALDTLDTKIGSQILQLSNQTTESIDNIETLIESESETMKTIETRIESMEEEGVHMANRTASMSIMLHEQNQELGKLTQAWSSEPWKKLAGANPIGFSAYKPVGLGDGKLGFNVVGSNEGGAFNPNTGIFTCPEAGMYYFILHLTKKRTNKGSTHCDQVFCSIICAGYSREHIQIDPEDTTADWGSYGVSGSVFIKLNVGDIVQLDDCSGSACFEPWSSFTGFLVAQ